MPMFLFAIVAQKAAQPLASGFWQQPIDQIVLDLVIYFGWIPFAITLIWGFGEMWLNWREMLYREHLKYVLLAIDVPAMTEQTPMALENLFASLHGAKSGILWKEKWYEGKIQAYFSFEIASTEGYIQFYVYTLTRYRDLIEASIYAHYPQAEISEAEDYTKKLPSTFPDEQYEVWGTELKLKESFVHPLRTYKMFEDKISGEIKDPLAQILEGLAKMKPGEHFWLQFVVKVTEQGWKDTSVKYIKDAFGLDMGHHKPWWQGALESTLKLPAEALQHLTGIELIGGNSEAEEELKTQMFKVFRSNPMEKERVEGIMQKMGKLGFEVKTRIVYTAHKSVYWKNARTAFVKGILHQFSHQNMNSFAMHGDSTPKDDYFWQRWVYRSKQTRLMQAYKARSDKIGATPSILCTEELASLWHFPPITIHAPLVKKVESRRSEPPVELAVAMGEAQMPVGEPPAPLEHGHGEHITEHDVGEEDHHVSFDSKHAAPSHHLPAPTPPTHGTQAPGGAPDNLPL